MFNNFKQEDKIGEYIKNQNWEGIKIVSDLPQRGRGVVTTRAFEAGEVICDYGGKLLNHRDGNKRYESTAENTMGYMFLFTHHGTRYWRDATEETKHYGRVINHSRCHANVCV